MSKDAMKERIRLYKLYATERNKKKKLNITIKITTKHINKRKASLMHQARQIGFELGQAKTRKRESKRGIYRCLQRKQKFRWDEETKQRGQ